MASSWNLEITLPFSHLCFIPVCVSYLAICFFLSHYFFVVFIIFLFELYLEQDSLSFYQILRQLLLLIIDFSKFCIMGQKLVCMGFSKHNRLNLDFGYSEKKRWWSQQDSNL
ncbi:MAG: hypothetical protein LBI20_02860 [Holosporales bacterium]|nr:hypothetical protein [Holosporales bacterium]